MPGEGPQGRVIDVDKGYDHFVRSFGDLKDLGVYVGIREDKGAVKPPDSDATVAEYATYNEFGTKHTPERSFLRSWEKENRKEIVERIGKATVDVLDGKQTIFRTFGQLGVWAVRGVQRNIRDIDTPPNAPSTIKRKKSSNPLIDSGRMRQSIEYEVREGGK